MQTIRALVIAAAAVAAPLASPALAAGEAAAASASHGAHHTDSARPAALTSGEVRQVDKTAGKITLKHGPITNLDMPGMTMVFRVTAPAMLEQVKAGDKVVFTAEKIDGALTLTRLERAK